MEWLEGRVSASATSPAFRGPVDIIDAAVSGQSITYGTSASATLSPDHPPRAGYQPA